MYKIKKKTQQILLHTIILVNIKELYLFKNVANSLLILNLNNRKLKTLSFDLNI